jgi:hypothetical protein
MLGLIMMRLMLQACSMMLGGLGMFFLMLSVLRPALVVCAVLFLATASAIVWSVPQS